MKRSLISYEEACNIVDNTTYLEFYKTTHEINGFKVECFSYRVDAWISQMENPYDGSEVSAHEMRGLNFVFNKDGSLFKRNLMLKRIWNYGQLDTNTIEVLRESEIISISYKEDGSLVQFIDLPNGEIIAKTKMGFDNPHSIVCNDILIKDKYLKDFIEWGLSNSLSFYFEYCSWENQIIVNYKEAKLVLLKARNSETGEYIDIYDLKYPHINNINRVKHLDISINEVLYQLKNKEDIEGFIIDYKIDGVFHSTKLKTEWYIKNHKLFTEDIAIECRILRMIQNNTIDDVIATISQQNESHKLDKIYYVMEMVFLFKKHLYNHIINIYEDNKHLSAKELFLKLKDDKVKFIHQIMPFYNKNGDKNVVDKIINRYLSHFEYSNKDFKYFLEEIKENVSQFFD